MANGTLPFPVPPVPTVGRAAPGGQAIPGMPVELQDIAQRLASVPEAERPALAMRVFQGTGQPAPPVPDFDTAEQAALGERRQANTQAVTTQQPQDDGTGGWLKFINALADPTGSANFLLTAGTNLLQPRPEGQSSLGFGLRGLGAATDRLTAARSARSAAELEGRKTAAEIGKTEAETRKAGAEAGSIKADISKVPSERLLNNARAYQAFMSGHQTSRGPQAAAQVQMLDALTTTLQNIAPDLYPNADMARIGAFGLMNPDTTRADFIADFANTNAWFYEDEQIAAQKGAQLADALGWTSGATLGSILQANAAAKQAKEIAGRPVPTDADKKAGRETREGAIAFAMKFGGLSREEAESAVDERVAASAQSGNPIKFPGDEAKKSVSEILKERNVTPTLPEAPKAQSSDIQNRVSRIKELMSSQNPTEKSVGFLMQTQGISEEEARRRL